MPHIEIGADGLIDVSSQYTEGPLIREVPGSRYAKDAGWRIPLSWPSCVMMRGLFGQKLTVGPKLAEWSQEVMGDRLSPALRLREALEVSEDLMSDDVALILAALDLVESEHE